MSAITCPSIAQDVRDLMTCLFGLDATVARSDTSPRWGQPHVVADYVDDQGVPRSHAVCDLQLANSFGAALTRIPASVAVDATKSGALPQNILENLREVLNVCVTLFEQAGLPHVVLGEVRLELAAQMPPDGNKKQIWSSWKIEIPKYPAGLIHLRGVQ